MVERIYPDTETSREIRVKLTGIKTAVLNYKPGIVIEDQITGQKMNRYVRGKQFTVEFRENRTLLNGLTVEKPFMIYSDKKRELHLNSKIYMGTLRFVPGTNGFEVINILPVEMYLLSVVPSEVPASFEPEALKAQSVIARTYAVHFINRFSESRDYDVDDTVGYQVFKGFRLNLSDKYIQRVKKAVFETKNQILTFQEVPAMTYFHANSGGRTVSGKAYFGSKSDFPYLTALDDPYSLDKKGSVWEYNLAMEDFTKLTGIDMSADTVEIKMNADNQVDTLESQGKYYTAKDLRKIIGTVKVKSERFVMTVDRNEKKIRFNGIGYGHGVGLSQWGAQGMAIKGFSYHDILQFYYPGTQLSQYQ